MSLLSEEREDLDHVGFAKEGFSLVLIDCVSFLNQHVFLFITFIIRCNCFIGVLSAVLRFGFVETSWKFICSLSKLVLFYVLCCVYCILRILLFLSWAWWNNVGFPLDSQGVLHVSYLRWFFRRISDDLNLHVRKETLPFLRIIKVFLLSWNISIVRSQRHYMILIHGPYWSSFLHSRFIRLVSLSCIDQVLLFKCSWMSHALWGVYFDYFDLCILIWLSICIKFFFVSLIQSPVLGSSSSSIDPHNHVILWYSHWSFRLDFFDRLAIFMSIELRVNNVDWLWGFFKSFPGQIIVNKVWWNMAPSVRTKRCSSSCAAAWSRLDNWILHHVPPSNILNLWQTAFHEDLFLCAILEAILLLDSFDRLAVNHVWSFARVIFLALIHIDFAHR